MTTRTLSHLRPPLPRVGPRTIPLLLVLVLLGGCGSRAHTRKEIERIPHPGVIDPHQPRELQMVSMPTYVVEPPDELEVGVRPAMLEYPTTTIVVQQDGVLDLGFFGEVYVAGLTLTQIEQKIAQVMTEYAARRSLRLQQPVEVSVRLVNGSQSKSYYVLGTVTTQGKFPLTGNETVLDGIIAAGLRNNSLPEKAYLVRPHPAGGFDQILLIDYCSITKRGDTLTNYQLFPGDRIIVPGTRSQGVLSSLLGGG